MPMPSGLPDTPVTASTDAAGVTHGPVFYLHGFASSAKSTKAGYFAERLREHQRALAKSITLASLVPAKPA